MAGELTEIILDIVALMPLVASFAPSSDALCSW